MLPTISWRTVYLNCPPFSRAAAALKIEILKQLFRKKLFQKKLDALLYVFVFGIGSIGGMMLMSLLVGFPVHLTVGRFARAHWVMRGLAGLFSLSFGLLVAYRIGFTDGLFR
jgi:hypothetical protein